MSGFVTVVHPTPRLPSLGLGRFWRLVRLAWREHQARRLLAEMDDHMLADIGASRMDAVLVASRPVWDLHR